MPDQVRSVAVHGIPQVALRQEQLLRVLHEGSWLRVTGVSQSGGLALGALAAGNRYTSITNLKAILD